MRARTDVGLQGQETGGVARLSDYLAIGIVALMLALVAGVSSSILVCWIWPTRRGLTKMKVEVLQNHTAENGHMAIVRALAESSQGRPSYTRGDATPNNCNAKAGRHLKP